MLNKKYLWLFFKCKPHTTTSACFRFQDNELVAQSWLWQHAESDGGVLCAGITWANGRRSRGERWRTSCPSGLVIQALSRWTTDYQRGCRPTKGMQQESCHGLGRRGKTHILCSQETDQQKATWLWKHTVTSLGDGGVNTDSFTDPRDRQTTDGEELGPIALHPLSLGSNLVEWTCAVLVV